jgi:glutathione S-transferase
MTLYHVHWCPECEVVRRKLADLQLPYDDVIVPDFRPQRNEVFAVSGQYYVPVLQDGDVVLSETHAILAHLESKAESRRLANG